MFHREPRKHAYREPPKSARTRGGPGLRRGLPLGWWFYSLTWSDLTAQLAVHEAPSADNSRSAGSVQLMESSQIVRLTLPGRLVV